MCCRSPPALPPSNAGRETRWKWTSNSTAECSCQTNHRRLKDRYEPSLRTIREVHEPPRFFEEGRRGFRPAGVGRPVARRGSVGRRKWAVAGARPDGPASTALSVQSQGDRLVVHGRRAEFGGPLRSQAGTHEARRAAYRDRRVQWKPGAADEVALRLQAI